MVAAKRKSEAKASKPRSVGTRASPKLVASLAEAAWIEADLALARALQDYAALEDARGQPSRKQALAQLGLSLASAARKRGLSKFGAAARDVAFDAQQHELEGRPGKRVDVILPGIRRGDGEVLIRARVKAST